MQVIIWLFDDPPQLRRDAKNKKALATIRRVRDEIEAHPDVAARTRQPSEGIDCR